MFSWRNKKTNLFFLWLIKVPYQELRICREDGIFIQEVLIFFLFLHEKIHSLSYIVGGAHWNCFSKGIPVSTHNICFHGEIRKLSGYP